MKRVGDLLARPAAAASPAATPVGAIQAPGGDDYPDGGPSATDRLEGDEGSDTCVDFGGFIVMDECEA
jgi:hypothetical protein